MKPTPRFAERYSPYPEDCPGAQIGEKIMTKWWRGKDGVSGVIISGDRNYLLVEFGSDETCHKHST